MSKRKKGTYKYICDDCQAENWLTSRERTSKFMPRCIECGSTWLEPSKASKGPDKISNANAAAYEQKLKINKEMGK
jgi:DNA-directed RNA polymerase subunit RPC12/RpoP